MDITMVGPTHRDLYIEMLKGILHISKVYVIWILVHYFITYVYIKVCTPMSFTGFLYSPFMAMTPYCKALQWLFNISVTSINTMWMVLGAWLSNKIVCWSRN